MEVMDLFLGRTTGVTGGTCSLLVILGGLYLLFTKTVNYRIIVSGIFGYIIMQGLLHLGGVEKAASPFYTLFAGSALIGIIFYATDPVSASQTNAGRWIYGAFVGTMSSLISVYSSWPAGTMFAILLANMFAPIMDFTITSLQKRGRHGQ